MDDYFYDDFEAPEFERERDVKIDEAKESLKKFFMENNRRVFYMKQLGVRFEKEFYHWISARALTELIAERYVKTVEMPLLGEGARVKFLFDPRYIISEQ